MHRAGDSVREGRDFARSEQHHEPRAQMRLDLHEKGQGGPYQCGQGWCVRLTTDFQAYGEERVGAVDAQNRDGQLDAEDINNFVKIEFDRRPRS